MTDFEKKSKDKLVKSEITDAFSGERPRNGSVEIIDVDRTPLRREVLEEINAWANLLNSLKDGLPLPNNPLINLRRIEEEEKRNNKDYSDLKACCSAANEVRDAKDFKPLIFKILKRIETISKINYIQ